MIAFVDGLTAFVLAGGKSSRMGQDKAFLPWKGGTLLSHALDLVVQVSTTVQIVGDPSKFSPFGKVVEDVFVGCGPLAAIHSALSKTTSRWNLILAVDIPFVEKSFLDYLFSQAKLTDAVVTLPLTGGRLQPLCAIYRPQFAEVAEQSLKEGKNKIDPLFSTIETRVIQPSELNKQGFSEAMFRNLNTPAEFEEAQHPS
jgi:molybdopterin-guanine dinucleotide biosynthesis protein A